MRPARLDIQLVRGDDYSLTLTFLNRSTGLAHDYSSATFAGQIRPDADSARVWDFAVDDTDSDTGVVLITLASADTAKMPVACVWDLQIDAGGGVFTTIVAGTAEVMKDVTRA